jgi:hypothetical protein
MLDETDRPESPGAPGAFEPFEPHAWAASGASPWSRDGSLDFVVSPTADGFKPASSRDEFHQPRRDRTSASKWIIGTVAAIAVVVVSAVLILRVARPGSAHAAPGGTSVGDLRATSSRSPAGRTPCRTDGLKQIVAQQVALL